MTLSVAQAGSSKSAALERSLLAVCREHLTQAPGGGIARQREAFEWLERNGMPGPRDEAWKNQSIAALLQESVGTRPARAHAQALIGWKDRAESGRTPILWLINGVAMTDAEPVSGVRWLAIADAIESDDLVRGQLGAHVRLENGFVAANVAGFSDGWCLVVDRGAVIESPIELRLVESSDARGALSLPRMLIIAGASSKLQLVERHTSQSGETILASVVTEIVLERGARVEHSRWVDHGKHTWSVAATAVRVGEEAEYRSWSGTARGRFVRHDLAVRLAGRRATAVLDGLYYARQGELVAQHSRVWHEQPEGVTTECYRGVIENQGRGIFDGIIYVGRGAMQTDARQENRNLLLGPEAIAHTKPHLEIEADDVTCSHGATVGQLDEQQLFYLRARGIAEADAREVLTWAFAKEIVERCPNADLRRDVENGLNAVDSVEPKLRAGAVT